MEREGHIRSNTYTHSQGGWERQIATEREKERERGGGERGKTLRE